MSLPRLTLPALACLWAVMPARAAEPRTLPPTVSPNQQIANEIAEQFRASGHLRGYRIDIAFVNGVAELAGYVGDIYQRDEALRLAHSVPGVSIVRNRLSVSENVARTELVADAPPAANPETLAAPQMQDPVPSFRAPVPTYPAETLPPPMPPYAWPTYAPYNNFSRVAYPTSYPYETFPHIGPVYPFPKVPLGWRSVKLEWDDGHWWLSNHAQQRDWWFIRYW